MAIFQRTTGTIRDKLAAVDRDLAAAKADLAANALASAIDDSPAADAAQAEIYRLEQRREVLTKALDAALATERAADLDKVRAPLLAQARAGDQHLARYRREAAACESAIADLVEHYTAAKAALGSFAACVGGDMRPYPGASPADLARAIAAEMFRVSAQPSQYGDRSDLPGASRPDPLAPPDKMPSLSDVTETATRHWAATFRASLGLGT